MKNKQPEYQHFIFKHITTGESVQFKIGPTPIQLMAFKTQTQKALKDLGKDQDMEVWTVEKAWCGDEDCKPPVGAK